MSLSKKDLAHLKKVIDRAILDNLSISEMRALPEAKKLQPQALRVLRRLTAAELEAFKSVYKRASKKGAKDEDLRRYGPIH